MDDTQGAIVIGQSLNPRGVFIRMMTAKADVSAIYTPETARKIARMLLEGADLVDATGGAAVAVEDASRELSADEMQQIENESCPPKS